MYKIQTTTEKLDQLNRLPLSPSLCLCLAVFYSFYLSVSVFLWSVYDACRRVLSWNRDAGQRSHGHWRTQAQSLGSVQPEPITVSLVFEAKTPLTALFRTYIL